MSGARATTVALRDGSEIILRHVRPADRQLLAEGFERLSEDSRYRRFLAPMPELTAAQLRYFTEVDHHDHEAIGALDPVSGRGVGIARYVRLADRPGVAEAAVTIADDWQARGVGTVLIEALAERAREEGIATFNATLLATNHEMLELFEHVGRVRVVDRETGTVEVEVDLPPAGLGPQLHGLLRAYRDARNYAPGDRDSPDAGEGPEG